MVEPIGSGYAPVMFDTRLAIRFPVAIALTSATILSVAPASSAAPADGPRVGSSSVWESAIVADPEYVPVEPLGDGSPIESGTVESTRNFRDVAGPTTEPLRNADGRIVRHGLAYRSNKLTNPTDEELGRMVGAGITRVVDMRNIRERSEQPDRLPAGVDYQVADVVDLYDVLFRSEHPHVGMRTRQIALAGGTTSAGFIRARTEHGLCKPVGRRAFAGARGAGEQKGMNNAPGLNRTHQSFQFVTLSH